MFFLKIPTKIPIQIIYERAAANLRWFELFRQPKTEPYPGISGYKIGPFFTARVFLGYMNSFQPVFFGLISNAPDGPRIIGFFAWPLPVMLGILAICIFGLIPVSRGDTSSIWFIAIILSMVASVAVVGTYIARGQKQAIIGYLAWLVRYA